MKNTLVVLNRLVAEKVIDDYAIGGAMGAMFYTESVTTMDLDVFVLFPDTGGIVLLEPIYSKLREWGYLPDVHERECVQIEGTPVQFLPAYNELLQEALSTARTFEYQDIKTKVMQAEYLATICVQTGRIKDKLRVNMFLSSTSFDREKFKMLLEKFTLTERFNQWQLK